jgi:MFS family permease
MPLSIFRIRNVRGANMIMAPLYATMLGSFFLLTLFLQNVLHLSPTLAGLAFLPFPVTLGFMSTRMPKLVARYGFKRFLIIGPLVVASGLLWLTTLHATSNYWTGILPAAILMPFGIGMTMMPVIAAATSGVPGREAGIASGLITTSQQMGGSLGLSILSGIAASVTASSLNLGATGAAIHGYRSAFLVATGFMVLASIIAMVVIRGRAKSTGSEDAEAIRSPQLQSSLSH